MITLLRRASLAVIVALLLGGAGRAASHVAGPVNATVLHVIDGDSIKVRARIWLDTEVEVTARLRGIDAPELHARCADERQGAEAARARLAQLTPEGSEVRLFDVRRDKYQGRVVTRVETEGGEDVSAVLLREELVRPYDGHRRGSWCRR